MIHEFYSASHEKCLESFKLENNMIQALFRLHFLLCREWVASIEMCLTSAEETLVLSRETVMAAVKGAREQGRKRNESI